MAEFKDGSYVIKDGTIYKVNIDLDRIFGTDVISIPFFLKKTNADRIRSMSDEELANCFLEWVACTDCPVGQAKCKTEWANCTKAALEWLRKEADDEHTE